MRFGVAYILLPISLSATLSADHSHSTVFWPRQSLNQPKVRTSAITGSKMAGESSFFSRLLYHSSEAYQTPSRIRGGGAARRPLRPSRQKQFQQLRSSSSSLHSSLSTLFDPLGIFTHQKWQSEPQRTFVKKKSTLSTVAPETSPPMVYFPEGGSGACQDFSPSSFNTYSFLSFLFSVANLIGLIANNVNSNLNNNNNNNNDNNNNLDNINVANSNSAQNNENNVNIPAAIGRRKRREVGTTVQKEFKFIHHFKGVEEVIAIVAKDFIRCMASAMLISDPSCALRNLCDVNAEAFRRGDSYEVVAEAFSVALVDMYPRSLPINRKAFLLAGSKGRKGMNCTATYQQCLETQFHHLKTDFHLEDLVALIPPEALTEILVLNDVLGISDVS